VLVYGVPLIRNIASRKDPLDLIQGNDVRTALALTQASFIDFALLLGTDFAPRIRNIGPVRALRLIRTYDSIEDLLKDPLAKDATDENVYLTAIRRARDIFNTLPPAPQDSELQQGTYDARAVGQLMTQHGLSHHLTEEEWDSSAPLGGNYFQEERVVFSPYCM